MVQTMDLPEPGQHRRGARRGHSGGDRRRGRAGVVGLAGGDAARRGCSAVRSDPEAQPARNPSSPRSASARPSRHCDFRGQPSGAVAGSWSCRRLDDLHLCLRLPDHIRPEDPAHGYRRRPGGFDGKRLVRPGRRPDRWRAFGQARPARDAGLAEDGRIVFFEEKPQEPKSTITAIAICTAKSWAPVACTTSRSAPHCSAPNSPTKSAVVAAKTAARLSANPKSTIR